MKTISAWLLLAALTLAPAALAAPTTAVSVTIGAEANITVGAATSLTQTGNNFSNFTGTTSFNYQIRTTQSTGSGSVVLQVTSDFSPAGGPSVATPPTAGDTLSYTCTGTGHVTGTQTASTTATSPVLSFGADAHSVAAAPGDAGSVSWTLVNDPKYKTGTYTATVTFTVSAT